jgi:hypothetical protein
MIPLNRSLNKRQVRSHRKALKRKKRYFILILFFISFFSIAITNTFSIQEQEQGNIINGIISDGEYDFNITVGDGDYSLFWKVIDNEIYFAIRGKTTGWVSIGIDPEDRMNQTDMIFGWVNNTGVYTVDAFATGPYGPHPPDTDLNGTDNILDFNGTEENEVTIIEFKRTLDTDDQYDKPIPTNGTVTAIWGLGSSDLFTSQHAKRGYFEFSLTEITILSEEPADYISPLFLSSMLSLSLIGLLIFVDGFGRKQQQENYARNERNNRGESE